MLDEQYMKICIDLAKEAQKIDEVPIGAIVVDFSNKEKPEIIAKAYNMRETNNSPTAHAEVLAIESASKKLRS